MTEHDIDCGCEEYNELSRRQFLARGAGVSAAALFPAWLPKIVMAKNFSSSRDIIVSVFQRGGADGLQHRRAVRRRQLLHVAPDDRDSAARLDRRDAGHQPRRLLHVPAGDGRRNGGGNGRSHARVPGAGPAHRARDRPAQQLAVALRRAAIHGSRQAGRSVARHGVVGPPPREHSAAQSRRRRCAASASRTVCRKRSSARR